MRRCDEYLWRWIAIGLGMTFVVFGWLRCDGTGAAEISLAKLVAQAPPSVLDPTDAQTAMFDDEAVEDDVEDGDSLERGTAEEMDRSPSPTASSNRPESTLPVDPTDAQTAMFDDDAEEDDSSERGASDADSVANRYRTPHWSEDRKTFSLVTPIDETATPFSLNASVFLQPRWTGFSPSVDTWWDSTGTQWPLHEMNYLELNRGQLALSGTAYDPKLRYTFIAWMSTSSNLFLPMGWLGYAIQPELELYIGCFKIFGTREWTTPFAQTYGTERTMATTFFRPGFCPGAWVKGVIEPWHLSYEAGVFTSFIGVPYAESTRSGDSLTGAVSVTWEPVGVYGGGISDIEDHETPTPRLGMTWAAGRVNRQSSDYSSNSDSSLLSLSDGTPLGRLGSLGRGTLIEAESISLASVDFGLKYRGMTLYHEWMVRWLGDFAYTGPAPERNFLVDYGAILQGGFFVIPKQTEIYARSSLVSGAYGTGYEGGGGIAWFPYKNDRLKVTGELLYMNRCPADNARTIYRSGETGVGLEFQVLASF